MSYLFRVHNPSPAHSIMGYRIVWDIYALWNRISLGLKIDFDSIPARGNPKRLSIYIDILWVRAYFSILGRKSKCNVCSKFGCLSEPHKKIINGED